MGSYYFISAQPHYHTQAKACVTDEGVTLRWAPTDMQSWQAGLSSGYIVERLITHITSL